MGQDVKRAPYQEAALKDTPPNRGAELLINDAPDDISDVGFVGEKADEGRGLRVVATRRAKAKAIAGKAAARASAAEAPLKKTVKLTKRDAADELDHTTLKTARGPGARGLRREQAVAEASRRRRAQGQAVAEA